MHYFIRTLLRNANIDKDNDRPLSAIIVEIPEEFITKWKWDKDKGIKNFVEVRPKDNVLRCCPPLA